MKCDGCGAGVGIGGADLDVGTLDSYARSPKLIWSGTAKPSDAIDLPEFGWLDFGGQFGAGWTISLGNDTPIPIYPGLMLPSPAGGQLTIAAAGTGQVVILHHQETIGRLFAHGRSFGSAASAAGNPKQRPTATKSLGKFTSVVLGAQITDATYLLAAGASVDLVVEVTGDGSNAKGVFLSNVSQADAAAFTCPPVYGAGIDYWSVPKGGKLFAAAADTLQFYYVKVSIA